MKPDIHPKCKEINVTCSCGHQFKVNSTRLEDFKVEVCDQCHSFYTGQKKTLEARGRVEQYRLRYETPRAVPVKPALKEGGVPKKVVKKVKEVAKKAVPAAKKVSVKSPKTSTKSKTVSQKAKKARSL